MKQQLLEKALKLGFKSKISIVHENLKVSDGGITEKLLYYLWLCELQKWIREVHEIHINIDRSYERGFYLYEYFIDKNYQEFGFKTYEEALEEGLLTALNLLP